MSDKCVFDDFGGDGHPYNYCISDTDTVVKGKEWRWKKNSSANPIPLYGELKTFLRDLPEVEEVGEEKKITIKQADKLKEFYNDYFDMLSEIPPYNNIQFQNLTTNVETLGIEALYDEMIEKFQPLANFYNAPVKNFIPFENDQNKTCDWLGFNCIEKNLSGLGKYTAALFVDPSGILDTKCGQQLGNKYVLKTGTKCRDAITGDLVDRYTYINNMDTNIYGILVADDNTGILPSSLSKATRINGGGLFSAIISDTIKEEIQDNINNFDNNKDYNFINNINNRKDEIIHLENENNNLNIPKINRLTRKKKFLLL